MSSDVGFKAMNGIHRLLLKVSGGRLGWTAMDMPVLELTTKGRKSGQPRSVMLTSPVQEGAALVVVASRGGDDQPPAWFLNLRDNPDVDVRLPRGQTSAAGCDARSTKRIHTSAVVPRYETWAEALEEMTAARSLDSDRRRPS